LLILNTILSLTCIILLIYINTTQCIYIDAHDKVVIPKVLNDINTFDKEYKRNV
jgi:hypothetical protein